jgi:glucose/arabinose dehydrogenase
MTVGLLAGAAAASHAQLQAVLVASGLSAPVAFAQDPSNPAVQLVAEKGGRVRVLVNGVLQGTDFIDLTGQVATGGEQGLLGIAFAPDFAVSGRVFLSFTNTAGHSVIARVRRASSSPLVADPSSRFDLRWPTGAPWIPQPFSNHNGGHVLFGPDGYLYFGLGDGGSGNDPSHYAQNPQSLLGKMLRLDVNVPDSDPEGYDIPPANPFAGSATVLPEIWAFGLRNPWRFSFDDPLRGGSGALLIADVGQNAWEEVNYAPPSSGGQNYGWRNREGAHDHVTSLPPAYLPLVDPIFEYGRDIGQSITGGFVYRGGAPGSSFTGRYVFADFAASRVWSLGLVQTAGGAAVVDMIEHTAELGSASSFPSSFGVDANGELYILNYSTGQIHRLAPVGGSSGTGGCTTPDPFVTLGGGTCVNGDWLPPGMAPAGSTSTPSAPSSSSGGCTTPDPFVSLGGGTCVNGGWLPPGMAPPPGVRHAGSSALLAITLDRLHDAGSVRESWRRHVRQWRLAAAGHGAPRLGFDAVHTILPIARRMHHARPVRHSWRRHLRQRRLAAAGDAASVGVESIRRGTSGRACRIVSGQS